MTELRLLMLRVLEGIHVGDTPVARLENRRQAIDRLRDQLKVLSAETWDEQRVLVAQLTADQRIPMGHEDHGVHMRHCYGLDDDPEPGMEGVARFACKYGQDDICPAALYKDPRAEYQRLYPKDQ